jgi:hypothetical protein
MSGPEPDDSSPGTSADDTESASGADLSHRESIAAAANGLGIVNEDDLLDLWFRTGKAIMQRVHRGHLSGWRPLGQDFLRIWDRFETILDHTLDRFEASFTSSHAVIDQLLEAEPTRANVAILRRDVPNNPITLEYFFSRLVAPDWVSPLKEGGFFDHPPAPMVAEDGGVRLPGWPQGGYLNRMAHVVPDEVVAIVAGVPETANGRVHDALADVLLSLPPELSADLIDKPLEWLAMPAYRNPLLSDKLVELAEKLARSGHIEPAIRLSRALLELADSGQEL